jgi:hypothetical protein
MDIHKPHAAKTWREFFIELATIVAGILIALGLEQTVEMIRRHADAAEARHNIHAELSSDISRLKARAASQACIDRRLDDLEAILDHAAPDGRIVRPSWIGRPPRWAIETSRWDLASNSGRASLLSEHEQGELGITYTSLSYVSALQNDEQIAWSRLEALKGVDRLTPDGALTLRTALQEARFDNWSLHQVSAQLIARAATFGVDPKPRDAKAPICWPLTTTPADALRQSGRDGLP